MFNFFKNLGKELKSKETKPKNKEKEAPKTREQKELEKKYSKIQKHMTQHLQDMLYEKYYETEKEKMENELAEIFKNKDPQDELKKLNGDYLKVNVGGQIFTTTLKTLTKVEGSYLARLFTGKANICLDRNGVPFIDRDGEYFDYVLDYLRDGQITLPKDEGVVKKAIL